MRRLLTPFAAIALLLSAAGAASATPPTPAGGKVWDPNQRVTYRWHDGDVPPQWMRAAINAAASDSNHSSDAQDAQVSQSDAGRSWVAYTADLPNSWAVGYTVTYIPSYFTMRLRPQGYPLDWGTLRWCQFYDSPPNGCYDAEMITLHEFGHVQTLDHPDDADVTTWTDTVMHWAPKTKAKAGWNQHEFGRCDVARLQIRYQPKTTSTPISTCLDLDTSLSLSAGASSATRGSTVTLTARLRVADNVSWPLLASEPLADRHVVLQRRAPGASSWSSVGTMSAADDNGRYSKTLTLSDTYDYRAWFNAPSNEGLESATSLVLRVTVSIGGYCGFGKTDSGGQMYTC